ncbi:10327_t:CDS:2 [Funneliformis geosporum]|nr:10327_t:CDS:2 [Funneliformis geosporum]
MNEAIRPEIRLETGKPLTETEKIVQKYVMTISTKSKIKNPNMNILATTSLALVGIGTILVGLGNASNEGAKQAKTYSEEKFNEAENLKQEAIEQKKKDNEE